MRLLSEPHAFDLEPASLRKLAPTPSLPFLLEYFNRRLLQEFRCRPLVHIEVVLDVAVAEHEIFADLDTLHVLRTQTRNHVDVLDALVRVLGVKIERLPVEDVRRGALVLVGPASDLDHGLHVGDDELRVFFGHHVGAGDDSGSVGDLHRIVRVSGQILDHLDLACRLLEMLEDLALGVDGIDDATKERLLQRAEGEVVFVVAAHPELRRVVHLYLQHLGLVIPVVRVRKLDQLYVIHSHVIEPQHVFDAHVFLDAPPVVLEGVQALRDADLLAFQILHPEDAVARTHRHAPTFIDPRRAQQPCAAKVGVDVDRRVEAAVADQVIEVVDVMRIPVVIR